MWRRCSVALVRTSIAVIGSASGGGSDGKEECMVASHPPKRVVIPTYALFFEGRGNARKGGYRAWERDVWNMGVERCTSRRR